MVALLAIAFVCWAGARLQDGPPGWVEWQNSEVEMDDDQASKWMVLEQKRVRLIDEDGAVLAQTPDSWLVQEMSVADIDGDDKKELVLLVWKRGSFGAKHPFWVRDEDDSWSQHIFVLRPVEVAGEFDRVWMSSALGNEVAAAEINSDSELVLTDREGNKTCWYWDSWGFTKKED